MASLEDLGLVRFIAAEVLLEFTQVPVGRASGTVSPWRSQRRWARLCHGCPWFLPVEAALAGRIGSIRPYGSVRPNGSVRPKGSISPYERPMAMHGNHLKVGEEDVGCW